MEKKSKSASLTVLLMILAMLISKLLGMLRGVLLAASYDISEKATAFSAASRIPLSFFDIVFASAILGCFIPVYNSFSGESNKEQKDEFTSIYLNFLLLVTGFFAILGIIFAEQLIDLVAPGLLVETQKLAVLLLRLMFPMIIFAAASYTLVGVLQSNGSFIVPAFISAVSNLFIILYFVFLDSSFGIKGLAIAYSLAWLIQLLTLVVPTIKSGYKYKLSLNLKNKGFIVAMRMTPSIIMGSWLAPLCLLISMRFAALTKIAGAVPSFEYAVNLFTVITGITTYGVCNYIFPKLSAQVNSNNDEFSDTAKTGLTSAILMTVIIAALVFSLAPQGISVVYQRGSFDADAVNKVTIVLRALVPGMIGFTLVEFLSRTFYALKKPRFPVISVIVGIVIDFVFVLLLTKIFGDGLALIGLSYSLGMLGAGLTMLIFSAFKIKKFITLALLFDFLKAIISGVISCFAMYKLNVVLSKAFETNFVFNLFSALFITVIGIIIYVVLLVVFRENTICSFFKVVKKRWNFEDNKK